MLAKICCMHNYAKIVSFLVTHHKADVNDQNPYNGWTPMHTAAYHNSVDAIWVSKCFTHLE